MNETEKPGMPGWLWAVGAVVILLIIIIIVVVVRSKKTEHYDATSSTQAMLGKRLARTGELDGTMGSGFPIPSN